MEQSSIEAGAAHLTDSTRIHYSHSMGERKSKQNKGVVGMRIVECRHKDGMVNYYISHSYYSEKSDPNRTYQGKFAKRLGLAGIAVDEKSFSALVKNRNPLTGSKLSCRDGKRVHAWDLNFHAPKGVSLLSALAQDNRIDFAFERAVDKAMSHAEEFATCRSRKMGANYDRETGELLWAKFRDKHSRPVGGVPDPHLHVHSTVFNVTWDKMDSHAKGLKMTQLYNEAPLIQAVFLSELAKEMEMLGYSIEKQGQGWDIAGIYEETKNKFSKRTIQVDEYSERKKLQNAKAKSEAGAKSREKKNTLSHDEILKNWNDRLSPVEHSKLSALKEKAERTPRAPTRKSSASNPMESLEFAVEKNFERNSVVGKSNLLADALLYKPGKVEIEDLTTLLGASEFVNSKSKGRKWITTQEVLKEEKSCAAFVTEGRGSQRRFANKPYRISDTRLSDEQSQCVDSILQSRDKVTALLGPAGSGKTTLIQEVERGLVENGHEVAYFAPSGRAVDVLKEDGFEARTIQSLFKSEKLQDDVHGKIIWVDEAGLLSFPQVSKLFDLAEASGCRIVMSGDPAQHTAVERGDALRVLLKHGGLNGPSISQIRRQRKEPLRDAIMSLADPERNYDAVLNGYNKLRSEGCIRELPDEKDRFDSIANDYLESIRARKSCLVVSPTHAEGKKATEAIRDKLAVKGKLRGSTKTFATLVDLSWETAEKRIAENFEQGLVVKFHHHAPNNLKAGLSYKVVKADANDVIVRKPNGLTTRLPLDLAERFSVFEQDSIEFRNGDKLQLTAKYKGRNGGSIANKSIFTVKGFGPDGGIKLSNGKTLDTSFAHLKHGYVTTSHSSQGETVDRVIVSQSSASRGAASSEQFYVSCSRARDDIHVYTDSSESLLDQVLESCHRTSATELVEQELRDRGDSWNYEETLQERHAYDSLQQTINREKTVLDSEKQREETLIGQSTPQPKAVPIRPQQTTKRARPIAPDLDR